MIVPMKKIFAAVKASDRDALLTTLGEAGVVHLAPVDTEKAKPTEQTASAVGRLGKASQILAGIEPGGNAPDMDALDAADRTLELYSAISDKNSRLSSLARQVSRMEIWGDMTLASINDLRDAGLTVKFYKIDPDEVGNIDALCVERVGWLDAETDVIACVFDADSGEITLPDSAVEMPLPERDRPSLRAEAAELEKAIADHNSELHSLANLLVKIETKLSEYKKIAEYDIASRGGLDADSLFAVQGWVPADAAEKVADRLTAKGLDAGIDLQDPEEEELPPTLIKYPAWASPISALFKMLGTVPGYKEFDLSPFFMIAMPIFTGMLIGDAGYGLLMALLPIFLWKKISSAAGNSAAMLILIFGLVTLGWGVLTANYFGVTPVDMAASAGFETVINPDTGKIVTNGVEDMMASDGGGAAAAMGKAATSAGIFYRVDGDEGRTVIIMISFILGTLHLVAAQLRQAIGRMPSITAVSHVGWAVFLVGMLAVVWMLFFPAADNPDIQWISPSVTVLLLAIGAAMVVLFSFPSKNPVKTILFGFVGNLLPMISTFSDTMSYIRLMAVGLASYYIAWAFNGMAMSIAEAGTWAWGFTAIILLLGHGLNIFLALIAVLAHGVRLNMLEFSNNVGVQWCGYAYSPFGADSK